MEQKTTFSTIDEYIAQFPGDIRERLQAVREAVRANAPDAAEKISYAMPAFFLNGPLVYFAAFKNHLGFFPTPDGTEAFNDRLRDYAVSKGGVRFPHDQPLPLELIAEIVRYRVSVNTAKKSKPTKKPAEPN